MDKLPFQNRIAGRLAVRGAWTKLLLGFGAMAVLLFVVTVAMRSLNGGNKGSMVADGPATPQATAPAVVAETTAAASETAVVAPASARPFPKAAVKQTTESGSSPLGALLIGIALLAALVAGLFVAAKFMRKARLLPADRRQQLKLRDVLSLGPKKALYVVGFEGRTLLIASGGEGVNLIADYTAEELGSSQQLAATFDSAPIAEVEAAGAAPHSRQDAGAPSHSRQDAGGPRAEASSRGGNPQRVPAAFRHLLQKEQGVELEA